jgi:uncharacterized protein with NAD-binding domain and iron-sulfur cluster
MLFSSRNDDDDNDDDGNQENDKEYLRQEENEASEQRKVRRVVVIGAGWGGLSAAHALAKAAAAGSGKHDNSVHSSSNVELQVTLVEASSRVGGLVRDGFTTMSGKRPAEAGQHGFWNNYHNIFRLLNSGEIPQVTSVDAVLTSSYAKQGQYSPKGLEAVWPVYRDQPVLLPTGLAQAVYTEFLNLPLLDKLSAWPLVLAFSDFDPKCPESCLRYDTISFRDLCLRLGVSRKCYEQAFEPMILTGLFAPGAECSAAAALGMAYFFVLQSQTAFDVKWCRGGNVGQVIFEPWVQSLQDTGLVQVECSTRVVGFEMENNTIKGVKCVRQQQQGTTGASKQDSFTLPADEVIMAVGAKALRSFVTYCPELARYEELRRFANLRGTSVLATRLFLDRNVTIPYSANACWGFDKGIGMTMFDIKALHGEDASTVAGAPGSVIEVDYYHADKLLVMSNEDIVVKVKRDLDMILGSPCSLASVDDAAIVRLPEAVNWYFPGSWQDMPDVQSKAVPNLYFAGDIVRTKHASWSQEKAFVTGMEAANLVLGRPVDEGILPVAADEAHVKLGKNFVILGKKLLVGPSGDVSKAPSLADFLF